MGKIPRNTVTKLVSAVMIIGIVLLVADILLTITKDHRPTVTKKAIITGDIKKLLDEQAKIIEEIERNDEVIAFINGDNVKTPPSDEELELSDADWVANGLASTLARSTINNGLSAILKKYDESSPLVGEIILTGKSGYVIGASNLTSDYYQADESWWQKAAAEPRSSYLLDTQSFDESIGNLAVSMSSAVLEGDEVIGVIKIVIDVDTLAASL